MANLQKTLTNLGLTEKEAAVYLALLELGPSTVLQISSKANINRPTTYLEIDSLKKRGLISTQKKGARQLFIAETPDQLKTNLDKEKKELEHKKSELAEILPDLNTLYNLSDEKPQVKFYEGKEGLQVMQEEFLKSKEKIIYGIFSLDDLIDLFPDQKSNYTRDRINKKIHTRILYSSKNGHVLKNDDKVFLRESKLIKPKKGSFNSDITIFDNKVAITSLKGKISGTLIEHPNIAKSFKSLFELLWDCH